MIKQTLSAGVLALGMSIGSASSAATIDLGFIMDRSGSIPDADYTAAMNSLASALGTSLASTIGSTDTYKVSVVTFNGGAQDVVTREINSQADLDFVVDAIETAGLQAATGVTNYKAAFEQLADNFGTLGDFSLINMMTDGNPNEPGTNANAEAEALAARTALFNAGWDSLSFEAVGGNLDTDLLQQLAFDTGDTLATLDNLQPLFGMPGQITDPLNAAFVLEVDNFGSDYDAAISNKVQKIVTPTIPLPAGLPLIAAGLAFFGLLGRKKARMAA